MINNLRVIYKCRKQPRWCDKVEMDRGCITCSYVVITESTLDRKKGVNP